MPDPANKFLLERFIAGECSREEITQVNRLLQQEEGKALMNVLLQEHWQQAASFEPDEQELQQWKTILQEQINPATTSKRMVLPTIGRSFWMRAAVWVGLLVSTAAIYSLFSKTAFTGNQEASDALAMKVLTNPKGRRASFLLADSTRVFLGPGSTISYPESFEGATREVVLQGEAFFEVAAHASKPFLVKTGEVYTRVLGTAFKIEAFTGKKINVSVTSGKVRVDRYANGKAIKELAVLTAGKQVSYTPQGDVLAADINIADMEAWLKGRLVFNGTPLNELANVMERWRDVQFEIKRPELQNMPVTVTVDNQVTIHQLLEGLSVIGDFKYNISNRKVIIY